MRKKRIIALFLPVLLLAAGCGQAAAEETTSARSFPSAPAGSASRPAAASTRVPPATTAPVRPQTTAAEPSQAKPDAALTLVASGDVLSHIGTLKAARQEDGSYNYWPMIAPIKDLLAGGDYTLVNLETPVAGKPFGYRGFPKFNAPVSLAQALQKGGVDMVVTANNHAMDSGIPGLRANLDNLDKIGLDHIGTYRSRAEARESKVVDINGIKVGFVATTTKVTMEYADDYSVDRNQAATMRRRIAQARADGAELIVFHIHWGKEYTGYPTKAQMDLYRILEEEGVDIVIGSHPHRLQPMALREIEYKGERKTQALIWSTANLLWGQTSYKPQVYAGAVFRIRAERKDGELRVAGLEYDLVYNLMRPDENGKKLLRLIPESDKEQYKKMFPKQYARMIKDFEWAHKTLARPVKLR